MKYTDDYEAKLKIWAQESKVMSLPQLKGIPRFKPQKFNSYEEFNRWKNDLVLSMAGCTEITWTK